MGSFITKLSGSSIVNDNAADGGAAAIFAGDIREVWHRHGTYVPTVSSDDMLNILSSQQFAEAQLSAKLTIGGIDNEQTVDIIDESRKAIIHVNSQKIVSVVGAEWHPMGFEILAELYGDLQKAHSGVSISSVLLLGNENVPCNRAIVVAKLAEEFRLDSSNGKDTIRPYLMLGIGHTGQHPLYSRNVATRGVCANTEAIAMSEKKSTIDFTLRHTKNMPNRIGMFSKQLQATFAYTKAYAKIYMKLHDSVCVEQQRTNYWRALLSNSDDSGAQLDGKAKTQFENNLREVQIVYKVAANAERVKPDTFGGAYSAYSEWLEYHATYKGEGTGRFRNQFESLTSGLNATKKVKAFQTAMELAGVSYDE